MATPIYGSQNFSTTLNVGGGIDNSQTTGIILTSVSGLNTSGGILCINWSSTLDTSVAEYIEYTGVSGNELTGVTRGVEGSSAKAHSNGATIVAVVSEDHINRLADKLRSVDAVLAQDTSANEIIKTTFVASAVNEITASNAATGNPPSVAATGGDTNIDLRLTPKGSGAVTVPSGTYETNVTSDDDIPNKKYVDDLIGAWTAAGETWTYASADDPTFTFTIAGVDLTTKYYPGMRIKLTQTTAKYFIITKVAFSTDTTITIYGGADYDLANAAITSPSYSTAKVPPGFNASPDKWTLSFTDTADRTQATPTVNVWYNVGTSTLAIHIGSWRVYYQVNAGFTNSSGGAVLVSTTLSTANNSEADKDFSAVSHQNGADQRAVFASHFREKLLDLASKTSYYLNIRTTSGNITSIDFYGSTYGTTMIKAVCAYL
jgi:hypothetical protein